MIDITLKWFIIFIFAIKLWFSSDHYNFSGTLISFLFSIRNSLFGCTLNVGFIQIDVLNRLINITGTFCPLRNLVIISQTEFLVLRLVVFSR